MKYLYFFMYFDYLSNICCMQNERVAVLYIFAQFLTTSFVPAPPESGLRVCLLVWVRVAKSLQDITQTAWTVCLSGGLGSHGGGGAVIVRDCTTVRGGMRSPLGRNNISAANTDRTEVG